jgi:hypothetical protein
MKIIVLFISSTILFFTAFAQKTNREIFEYRYTHIPEKLIYDQIKTYGTYVNVLPSNGFTLDYNFATSIAGVFNAYTKVPYENADMQIKINYGPYVALEEKTVSAAVTEEVNGVKVSKTKYKRRLTFRFPINYTITNRKNGVQLYYHEHYDQFARTIETQEYYTEQEAVNYFDQTRLSSLQNNINQHVQLYCSGINGAARDLFDFYPTMGYGAIFKFKKWDKADEYNDHVKHVINTFKLMTADENAAPYLQKLSGDINYFKQFEGKFIPDDKDEDILYFGNYYNLASIYTFLDDYKSAAYFLQKLDSSKKEKTLTASLNNILDRINRRNAKHFLANTHINYNPVSDYRLSDKTILSDAMSSTEQMTQSVSGGIVETSDELITTEGKTLLGKIFFERETAQLKMILTDKTAAAMLVTPSNSVSLKIGNENYIVAKANVDGALQKNFYRIEYKSDKIQLLQLLKNDLTVYQDYLGLLRPNEDLVNILLGLSVKKNMGKYFKDCPTVSDKAKDGEYGGSIYGTKDRLGKFIEMCKQYTDCK